MSETSHFAEVKFKSLACQISPDSFELCRDEDSRVKGNGEKGKQFRRKESRTLDPKTQCLSGTTWG